VKTSASHSHLLGGSSKGTSLILTEEEKELLLLCGADLGASEKPKNLAAIDESSGSGPGHNSPGGSNKGMTLRRR
jgi:hypothetical protein